MALLSHILPGQDRKQPSTALNSIHPESGAKARLSAQTVKKTVVMVSASLSASAFLLFPFIASAGIFSLPAILSSVWVQETSAAGARQNSQTVPVLSPVTNIDPKAAIGGGDIALVGGVALISEAGPSGTAADVENAAPEATSISVYTVHKGDTLSGIAKMFDVSPNTILWANDIPGGKLKEGMELVILPVTGVRYTVKKGDTLASIAKAYKADPEEIIEYNAIDGALAAGTSIIIPDGEVQVSVPVRTTVAKKPASVRVSANASVGGTFSWPVQGGVVTQGIHGYNGVDIGAPIGTPILASAAGTVIVARSNGAWNGGYGNYVVIQHDNGAQTLYAHATTLNVSSGQRVSAGENIATVGRTGKATGPHLHFEIRGAVNPFGR